ncbi:hypothetical protein HNO89_001428 [Sporosarcina luteola]|nr:hypothetical protein [Sporosarcina luteola]
MQQIPEQIWITASQPFEQANDQSLHKGTTLSDSTVSNKVYVYVIQLLTSSRQYSGQPRITLGKFIGESFYLSL